MSSLVNVLKEKYGREVLSIEELALELGVEVNDLADMVINGELKVLKIGKKIRVDSKEIERMFCINEINENEYQQMLDQMATPTLTSQQTEEDSEIVEESELWKDDNNMVKGTITYVKKSNRWLYQLNLGKLENGKRHRVSKSFKTEEEAREALQVEVDKFNSRNVLIEQVTAEPKVKVKLSEAFDSHIGDKTCHPNTIRTNYQTARRIIRMMSDTYVDEITKNSISDFLNTFKVQYKQSVLDNTRILLNATLNNAVEKKFIEVNPMLGMKKVKSLKETGKKKDKYNAFKNDELRAILECCSEKADLYAIVKLLQYTGLRPGELRGLKWSDINFEESEVNIERAATQEREGMSIENKGIRKEFLGPTKSSYGVRTIPLNDKVLDVLKAWKVYLTTSKEYSKAKDSEYVFPSTRGELLGDSGLDARFRKQLKKHNLDGKGYRLYTFRHTFCTNLNKMGVDIATLQMLMGDSTTDVIVSIYTSIDKEHIKKATVKLNEYYIDETF